MWTYFDIPSLYTFYQLKLVFSVRLSFVTFFQCFLGMTIFVTSDRFDCEYPFWLRLQEEFEDTKVVIRIGISKKNRHHNGQKKKIQKDKQRFTQLTQKTKDRVTRTPLKSEGELRCSRKVSSYCSNSGIRSVNLVTNPVISHESGKDSLSMSNNTTIFWFLTLTLNYKLTASDQQYYTLLIPNPNPKL